MARYHLNPERGPMPCSAEEGRCPYGTEAPHFTDRAEAQKAYEAELARENPLEGLSREGTPSVALPKFEEMSFDRAVEFANLSQSNHSLLDLAIEQRGVKAVEWAARLQELNPWANPSGECDRRTFYSLREEFQRFKDETAALVEAHCESPHFKPSFHPWDEATPIGRALPVKNPAPHGTLQWHLTRFNTVGGSDVGALVVHDFVPEDQQSRLDKNSFELAEESKLVRPTLDSLAEANWASRGSRSGPLYRGTVWETRSRHRFAEAHPHLKVYDPKSQYFNPERPWQQVNFDGLVSSKEDGVPTGILELKTGSIPEHWDGGPPLAYRAQVLYYLDTTGLDEAHVGVVLNDGEERYFALYASDPVAPGKYDKPMSSYVEERVKPWFEGLQSRRKAA